MSSHGKDKPLNRVGTHENGKPCTKCKAPFIAAGWPRTQWTLTGWSPWCPRCHADFAHDTAPPVRRGPKSKAAKLAWTDLPV